MCTAISCSRYFGRNFDYYFNYGQAPVFTPRTFKYGINVESCRYALLGMGIVINGYPLYFDAVNEKGLSMAALEYPVFCKYRKPIEGLKNIASYELIPWILCQCSDVAQVKELVRDLNITDESFSAEVQSSPLHWIISDSEATYVLEQNDDGLTFCINPAGVLTNSPSFDVQMLNLARYGYIRVANVEGDFCNKIPLQNFSNGTGALGLPGDFSSMSRFVKACFVKSNVIFSDNETENVANFFRMLASIIQINGCVVSQKGNMQTFYSSCCDMVNCKYYYITNDSLQINVVDMNTLNKDAESIMFLS